MTTEAIGACLVAALQEGDQHHAVLAAAIANRQRAHAANPAVLKQDLGLRRLTDQNLYRFTELKDAMGE